MTNFFVSTKGGFMRYLEITLIHLVVNTLSYETCSNNMMTEIIFCYLPQLSLLLH